MSLQCLFPKLLGKVAELDQNDTGWNQTAWMLHWPTDAFPENE